MRFSAVELPESSSTTRTLARKLCMRAFLEGQLDEKAGAFAFVAAEIDCAPVRIDDLLRVRETESRAFGFRREKRRKKRARRFCGNSRSVVAELKLCHAAGSAQAGHHADR